MSLIGVALAGGNSRRMGRDKAGLRLTYGSRSFLEDAVDRLGTVCREVLVADRGRGLLPGKRSVEDGPGAGPAAGLLGAAAVRPGHDLLVLACDLPLVPAALLQALVSADASADWVVPRAPRLEPLCALYRERALETLRKQVEGGDYALYRLSAAAELRIRCLNDRELRPFGPPTEIFRNVNTPEDLAALRGQNRDG